MELLFLSQGKLLECSCVGFGHRNLPCSNPLLLPKLPDFTSVTRLPLCALFHAHSWLLPTFLQEPGERRGGQRGGGAGDPAASQQRAAGGPGGSPGLGLLAALHPGAPGRGQGCLAAPKNHPQPLAPSCAAASRAVPAQGGFGCHQTSRGPLCPQIEAVLGPAEKNVVAMGAGLAGLAEQLSQLQQSTEQNRLRAGDTRDTAGTAAQRASGAQQVQPGVGQLGHTGTELPSRYSLGWAHGDTAGPALPSRYQPKVWNCQLCPALSQARPSCAGPGTSQHRPTAGFLQSRSQP